MLSKVEYTAPQYIAEDVSAVVQIITIKNGVESDPTEITLTAKAIAPVGPIYDEQIEGEPNKYVEFEVQTEPNTTIEIVSCSFGTATVNGANIKITFPDTDVDQVIALVIKAKRGNFESNEVTINGNCVIPTPAEPVISGVSEMDENTIQTFVITNKEEGVEYSAEATQGSINSSDTGFIFSAGEVDSDTEVTLTFTAKRKSKTSTATKVVSVKNVLKPSADLELAESQTLSVKKDETLDVEFKNVQGTLSVENKSEFYGTAEVQGNKVVVTGVNRGTANFSVTQTEDDKAPSNALEFSVQILELSTKLTANSSNASEVKVGESIELSFDNVSGEIAASSNEFATAEVQTDKVAVQGVSEGTAIISVTQTETDKDASEALEISITVNAADVVDGGDSGTTDPDENAGDSENS